jgi:hypothetical protein
LVLSNDLGDWTRHGKYTFMTGSGGVRIALLFVQSVENATLSYQHGWPRAFAESSLFSCTPINLAGLTFADRMDVARRLHTGRFDAIVLLHSVFSNQQNLRGSLFWALAACKVPKAYFIGNEYKLMPEKIRFCRRLGISLLITQSNDERVLALYRETLGCEVHSVPNTGIDPMIFRPISALAVRPIDIGYRSFAAAWYLGNNEKSEIAEYFTANVQRLGISVNISLDPKQRFDTAGYAAFLNSCRAQIGTEAGGDFFEITDRTRVRVNAYTGTHPETTWPEVKRMFFDSYGPSVPMRIISGRQVEAAACKTVQILFEGRYSGFFEPDIHYIPLRKDFANAEEAVSKFRDEYYCSRLTKAAFEVAMSELTYAALINKFYRALRRII